MLPLICPKVSSHLSPESLDTEKAAECLRGWLDGGVVVEEKKGQAGRGREWKKELAHMKAKDRYEVWKN